MSKQTDPREPGPVPCDDCIFQVPQDNSEFFCVRRAPIAQSSDGRAQFARLSHSGLPAFKGCGDGRHKKDNR